MTVRTPAAVALAYRAALPFRHTGRIAGNLLRTHAALSMEVFTDAWAAACCEALNQSPPYRVSAAAWRGSIVLAMSAGPAQGDAGDRRVLIDAQGGTCRGARCVNAEEAESATFVFQADPATWRTLLAGELDPVTAVMMGRLRLTRGSLFVLARFAQAARDMVSAAASVPASFPEPAQP
jgi:putative sterol carrier protein